MGWGIHGRRALLRFRSGGPPISLPFPPFRTRACSHRPASLGGAAHAASPRSGAPVCCCLSSGAPGSGIETRPNGSASVSLFSSALVRFASWGSGLSCFRREISSLGYSGKVGRFPVAGGVKPAEVAEIVELVKGEDNDMELRLNQMNLSLSPALVCEALLVLNSHGASALRFFTWVVEKRPGFRTDSAIYNLVIDNLGRLHDYGRMLAMLKELSRGGHCLTERAFTFLTFNSSVTAKDALRRTVQVLSMAGGSCRGSGIYSLIKMFCDLSYFEFAVFVMEETARKTSYYNVLISAKCRNGDFQDAYDLFDEMRRQGCDPSTKSYNYLLGSLFKNNKVVEACELLESMEGLGYHPDSITFEVVIFHACRIKRMDFAIEFLRKMLLDGIEPRFTTHAAFIKGYFLSDRAADAHKYVADMSEQDKCSANMNYSLLANLFCTSGMVIEAGAILLEMMDKNLKPNHAAYVKITKNLYKLGRGDLASDLKQRFTRFHGSKIS